MSLWTLYSIHAFKAWPQFLYLLTVPSEVIVLIIDSRLCLMVFFFFIFLPEVEVKGCLGCRARVHGKWVYWQCVQHTIHDLKPILRTTYYTEFSLTHVLSRVSIFFFFCNSLSSDNLSWFQPMCRIFKVGFFMVEWDE